jgi:4-aminobutyrate aminotransferase-like enzyme
MIKELQSMTKNMPHVGEVRGRGMMIGIEFNDRDGNPSKEIAERVAEKCLEQKMLVLTCGHQGQVIRLIPPLTISDSEIEKAMDILSKSMTIK